MSLRTNIRGPYVKPQVQKLLFNKENCLLPILSAFTVQRMKKLFVLGIFLFSLIGCSSVKLLFGEKPTAELREVQLMDASFSGGTLLFIVNVANPNSFDLVVDEIDYKVFLSGKELSEAKIEKPFAIPAKGNKNIEMPLPIKFGDLFEHLSHAFASRALDYRIEGNVKLGFTKIPFSKEGKLELK
ncbi:MAG: LEA type 2 family protein [Bdellovibrio sp.]